MRATAILGTGNLSRVLARFVRDAGVEWTSLIEDADVAIVFGGDGTIHRHLPELIDLSIPALMVPCGSGNDFARALGIRNVGDAIAACKKLSLGGKNVRRIDLGRIEELEVPSPSVPNQRIPGRSHPFCCVAGVGLDSEIARRANQLPRWIRAHGGYALTAPREFIRFPPFPMRLSCNGASSGFRPTLLAAVANAPTYGGGMKIAPGADLADGKLDVCVVRGMDVFKLFCLFPTVYFGRHLAFKEVEYQQAVCVRIETEHPLDVYADGEYICRTPVEISVVPDQFSVVIP